MWALVLFEVQYEDAFPRPNLIPADKPKPLKVIQITVKIQALTVGKQFPFDSLRSVLKDPVPISQAPQAHEEQSKDRVFLPEDFVFEQAWFDVSGSHYRLRGN